MIWLSYQKKLPKNADDRQAGSDIIYQHTGLESMVLLDQNLLKTAVNLINNAIKYSGKMLYRV
ncbi:hypothetical protein CS542_10225 [Pedobacter sp. IW39]|nr:hypothetical protein CS542_10225 [Pedobacter sp. IW39]